MTKKNLFEKKLLTVSLGLAAVMLSFGLALVIAATAFVSCDNGSDSGGGGGVDTALVGKWYKSQESANEDGDTNLWYTFNADGICVLAQQPDEARTFTASGGKLTVWTDSREDGTANYSISGTVLTLTNAEHGLEGYGATFYKKASE